MALVTISKTLLQQNYSNSQGVGYHGLSCIMALKQLCVIVTKETTLSVYVSIVTSSRGIVVIDGGMLITVFCILCGPLLCRVAQEKVEHIQFI